MLSKTEIIEFQRKKFLVSPRYLQIEITNRCALSCPQCYKDVKASKDMDLELFEKICLEADMLNVHTVTLNGGEPFMHNNFTDIINIVKKHRFKTYCYTSGYGITEDIINEIYTDNFDFLIAISLNGSTKDINELSRDGYYHSIEAMNLLSKKKVKYGVNWVCRHDNIRDFPALVEKVKNEYGASWINITANKTTGEGTIVEAITADDYEFLIQYIENSHIKNKGYIRVQYCYNILNSIMSIPVNKYLNICGAGSLTCCVTNEGYFTPCTHLYYPEKFFSIQEYWESSQIVKRLRDDRIQKSKCKGCSIKADCNFCKAMSKDTSLNFEADLKDCPIKELLSREAVL